MQILPWLGSYLTWQVGDGKNILLGIDPIVGIQSSLNLPEDLRTYLEDLNICTLSQARNTVLPAKSYWLSADGLDLGGSYHNIWDVFIKELQVVGIHLTDSPDTLLWSYNKCQGSLSAKAAYDSIVGSFSPPVVSFDDSFLWNRNIPSKISCFIWLTIRNRILTWENL